VRGVEVIHNTEQFEKKKSEMKQDMSSSSMEEGKEAINEEWS
jgi:hypothetical protein